MVIPRRSVPWPALGAALLVLIALLTTSGDLGTGSASPPASQLPTAWVDVVLILAGGGALVSLIGDGRGRRGWLSVGLFGALTALAALSVAWSVAPDQSWQEAGRDVAYLGAFLLAVALARRSRADSRAALLALTLAALALCAWALLVKALDLNLYGQPSYGRLLATFAYWNATGLTGALALPGSVWIASRRGGSILARGLGAAGITLAATVVVLSLSRSALAAALLGVVVTALVLRTRRRAVAVLLLGLLGGLPVWIDALSTRALAADSRGSIYGGSAHLQRGGAELVFGLVLLAAVGLVAALAGGLGRWLDVHPQPASRRRLADRMLALALLAVPVLIALWLLTNARGPFGEISHLWHRLTSANSGPVGDQAARLTSVTNSRAAYWRQALSVGEHHLLAGTGVGTFFPAHLRYATARLSLPGQDEHHAHSYVFDTFASLGLIGIALMLALLGGWLAETVAGLRRPGPAAAPDEFDARLALLGLVAAFGVSSGLDWTWFYPGVTLPALMAAGWLAGIGTTVAGPTAAVLPLRRRPGLILAGTLIGALTLAAAWMSFAPTRADRSIQASVNAQIAAAAASAAHRPERAVALELAALGDARAAVSQDPLSVTALARLAAVDGALGDGAGERAELLRATQIQPENPQPWILWGGYLLCRGDFFPAREPLFRATLLDLTDSQSQLQMLAAAQTDQRPSQFCAGAA